MNLLDHRFRSGKADGPDATQVQPSHWNDGHVFLGGTNGHTLVRDISDATYGASWSPHGFWTAVPYDAANFSAESGATWTVAAGNVTVQRYMIIAQTMRYNVSITGSTIAGNPPRIRLALPAPFRVASDFLSVLMAKDAASGYAAEYTYGITGETNLWIARMSAAPWSAGTTEVYVTVTLEIQ